MQGRVMDEVRMLIGEHIMQHGPIRISAVLQAPRAVADDPTVVAVDETAVVDAGILRAVLGQRDEARPLDEDEL